jgi:hypothetical protein
MYVYTKCYIGERTLPKGRKEKHKQKAVLEVVPLFIIDKNEI